MFRTDTVMKIRLNLSHTVKLLKFGTIKLVVKLFFFLPSEKKLGSAPAFYRDKIAKYKAKPKLGSVSCRVLLLNADATEASEIIQRISRRLNRKSIPYGKAEALNSPYSYNRKSQFVSDNLLFRRWCVSLSPDIVVG
jgi:hypothetical protein